MNHSRSDFMSAYRKGYSTNHALMRLIENWRKALDNSLFTGAVLMDLSKAFDCITHDLLIVKLHAYGLGFDTSYFPFYLFKRKKTRSIN